MSTLSNSTVNHEVFTLNFIESVSKLVHWDQNRSWNCPCLIFAVVSHVNQNRSGSLEIFNFMPLDIFSLTGEDVVSNVAGLVNRVLG